MGVRVPPRLQKEPMKIIFLDDMEERHGMVTKANKGEHEIIRARNVQEAIAAIIANPNVDLMCIDHDLAGPVFEKPGAKGTGSEVAQLMAKLPPEILPKEAIIHTWNEPGAQYIYHTLQGRFPIKWVPFGTDFLRTFYATSSTNINP